ncbi:nitroreductase (plasmid) [Cupriavidus pinatubonensis]|uniref:nitroreductase n=1 Tax=Cupriavidus pinatubonensis TaxID=248026 RepID=UPI001C73D79A|nr:nitroreductase [Cupriavidus pinatubonensis]QYY33938.1 nitroreductase [Cupriavidus pinatubonensis]
MTTHNPDTSALRRLIFGRATCRAYLPEQVPEDVIRSIVDVALGTASWCNTQPWDLIITAGESTDKFRNALMEQVRQHPELDSDFPFPDEYRGAYLDRRRESGFQLYEALGIGRGDKERRESQSFENFRLFGAPHVMIVSVPEELGPYGAIDAGGFVSAFLLSAEAHGVATTPQAAMAMQSCFIRNYFGIPDGRKMVCGISFGYADKAHPVNGYRTRRASVDDILHLL